MTVFTEVLFVTKYLYHGLEKFPTKIVAALYLLLLSIVLDWAMNPNCMLIIWSIEKTSIGIRVLKDRFVIALWWFSPPWFLCHGTKKVTVTFWLFDLGEMSGYLVQLFQKEQPVKSNVSQMVVLFEQFFIIIYLRCRLVFYFGWWLGIKSKRINLNRRQKYTV